MDLTFTIHWSDNAKASGVTVIDYLHPFREP